MVYLGCGGGGLDFPGTVPFLFLKNVFFLLYVNLVSYKCDMKDSAFGIGRNGTAMCKLAIRKEARQLTSIPIIKKQMNTFDFYTSLPVFTFSNSHFYNIPRKSQCPITTKLFLEQASRLLKRSLGGFLVPTGTKLGTPG